MTENSYPIANLNTWEAFEGNYATSKIRYFNPMLYSDEYNQPDNDAGEMKATAWLLDTAKWSGLVTSGSSTAISNKIKYIVGAPSVEMIMDSYNTYFGLTDADIDTYYDRTSSSSRTKLIYSAPSTVNYGFGYAVGPCDYDGGTGVGTNSYTIQPDENITGMYTICQDEPRGDSDYTMSWVASPSDYDGDEVLYAVYGHDGAGFFFTYSWVTSNGSFHPVVALDSDVILEFAEN